MWRKMIGYDVAVGAASTNGKIWWRSAYTREAIITLGSLFRDTDEL